MTLVLELLGAALALTTLPGTILLFFVTVGSLLPGKRERKTGGKHVRMAALVPAHNEELLIRRCVMSLKSAGGDDFEVWVVADNCDDCTARYAAEAGARVLVRNDATRRGKGYALQLGFETLTREGADAILIVDADSVVSSNLVQAMRQRFAEGADAVQCRYRVLNPETDIRRQLMDLALLAFNILRPLGRQRLGLSAGILGNGFAVTSETLEAVPYLADSVVEDLEYHLHIVRADRRVVFADDATVYGEIPMGDAAADQRARWEGGRLRMARQWIPRLVGDAASGRLRAIEPLVELLTLPIAYHMVLVAAQLAIGPAPFRYWAIAQAAIVAFHVVAASARGEGFPRTLAVLAAAPFYVVWKFAIAGRTIRASRPKAEWVRSGRQA